MSYDFNLSILIGHLGKTPNIVQKDEQHEFATLSLATNENWFKNGEKHQHTEWHEVIVNGPMVKFVKRLNVGDEVLIMGKSYCRKWKDKEGHDRFSKVIIAQKLRFLSTPTTEAA